MICSDDWHSRIASGDLYIDEVDPLKGDEPEVTGDSIQGLFLFEDDDVQD